MKVILTGYYEKQTCPDGINLVKGKNEIEISYSTFNERYIKVRIGDEEIVLQKNELSKAIIPF